MVLEPATHWSVALPKEIDFRALSQLECYLLHSKVLFIRSAFLTDASHLLLLVRFRRIELHLECWSIAVSACKDSLNSKERPVNLDPHEMSSA